jgi:hypothetical protein
VRQCESMCACMCVCVWARASTSYDGLLEELLSQVGQEADYALPGDLPQVRVAGAGVRAVEDPCCVHHQQHVLQGLRDGLQLGRKQQGPRGGGG